MPAEPFAFARRSRTAKKPFKKYQPEVAIHSVLVQLERALKCLRHQRGVPLRVATILAAFISALMFLTACGNLGQSIDEPTAALPLSNTYRLAPGDRLKVNVFNETDLSGEYQVSDRGSIAFPLIGEVHAAGMTVEEFRLSVVDSLRGGFVRNPRVTVEVANYRPINVIGEVRNAGQYAYRPGISIQDAIAMAGGYTYRANTNVVYVTRGGNADQIEVDLKKKDDNQVFPGDNLRIPERYF